LRIRDPGSVLVARQLYEGLTAWDPVAEAIVPAAAESWKESDGGRVYTFKLRQGATFHDGSPVTSKDFAFAFNRIALKENGSELAYTLERIAGFDAVNGFGTARKLSGIETPDDLTLRITLTEPYRDLPAVLTHPSLVPLPKQAVDDLDTFLSEPVGNGPFEIGQPWQPEESVVLRAFAGAFDTPSIDGIRFVPFPDAAASWLQFVDGRFDVAEVPAGQIDAAAAAYTDRGFQPFLAGSYFGLNVDLPELSDVRLRKAVNRAIDRDTIAATIYKGTLEPPRGIVPAGMPGFQENVCAKLCEFSPEAARSLVDKLPRNQRQVVLEYTKAPPNTEVAQAVKENLAEVGITARINAYPFPKFLKRLREGDQAMYRLGWIAEYPAPDAFLSSLFRSDSPDNHSGFASAEVDALLDEAEAEPSAGKRLQLYIAAEKRILQEVPIVPIGSFVTHWAAQPEVQGIGFDMTGGFDAVSIFIEETEDPDDEG
jgi:peptide/nickel transport system substrate-binding protein/oligopeptide transport system substrate-binding protein